MHYRVHWSVSFPGSEPLKRYQDYDDKEEAERQKQDIEGYVYITNCHIEERPGHKTTEGIQSLA